MTLICDVVEVFKEGSLDNLLQTLIDWQDASSERGLFMILQENDVRIQDVIDSLADKFEQGWETDTQSRLEGVTGARVYVQLVLVPGSSAFQVFHPQLYEKILDHLTKWASLVLQNESYESSIRNRSSASVRASQKRKKRPKRRRSDSDEEEDDDIPSQMEEEEVHVLKRNLHILLQDLVTLVTQFPLRTSEGSASKMIQTLAKLTRHEVDLVDTNFANCAGLDRLCISALAYKGLQLMWSDKHGDVGDLIDVTFRSLLPNLLMLEDGRSQATVNRNLQIVQTQTSTFICHQIQQFKEPCYGSVRSLLQHLCVYVPDRAEYRARVSETVSAILDTLPLEEYCRMVRWVCNLAQHKEVSCRGFAVEIVSQLLSSPLRAVQEDLDPELVPYASYQVLLETLYKSCSDTSPSVRTKALSCMCVSLQTREESLKEAIRDIIIPGFPTLLASRPSSRATTILQAPGAQQSHLTNTPGASLQRDGTQSLVNTPGTTIQAEATAHPSCRGGLFHLLRKRARDGKVLVRKAALQTLEYAVKFEMDSYSQENVQVLQEHCRDPGLSARKQAMLSLTELLLERPEDTFLMQGWLDHALPRIGDKEQTLADKTLEILEDTLLRNIVPYSKSKAEPHFLAWRLLAILSEPSKGSQRGCLRLACKLWGGKGKILPGLATALLSHVGTENDRSAWTMLAEAAPYISKVNPDVILNYWKAHTHECSVGTRQHVLIVLAYVAAHLSGEARRKMIEDLKTRLLEYTSPVELVTTMIETLTELVSVEAEKTGSQPNQKEWLGQLLRASETYLSRYLRETRDAPIDEATLACHLCTFGEAATMYPGKLPERAVLMVKCILAAGAIPDSQPQNPCKDADESTESQSSQGSQSSQASTQPLSQFGGSNFPSHIRSLAFVTLGKICLKKHSLAKKYTGAIVRELETSTDPGIRNNLMILLCDLARRYTSVTNQYTGHIFSCLQDPATLVRRQTLRLLTDMLQEDYLKWKGDLFYRFLACVLDELPETRQYAETCLELLLERKPLLFVCHFTEAVYVYNNCTQHSTFNKYPETRGSFHFKGEENRKRRQKLYNFMLQRMKDEHKFTATNKLCQEVLGLVVDNVLQLNDETSPVVKDALTILTSKELKLSVLRDQAGVSGEDETTEELSINSTTTVKKVILCRVMKSNVSQNILPIILSLKHVLSKKRSPLLRELLLYLRELMKDFKAEVQEALADHKDLAKEIEFDLRKFEEQQQQEAQNATTVVQVLAATPTRRASPAAGPSPRPPASSAAPTASPVRGSATPGTSRGSPAAPGRVQGSPRATPAGSHRSPIVAQGSPKAAVTREPRLSTMALVNLTLQRLEAGKEAGSSAPTPTDSPKAQQATPTDSPKGANPSQATPTDNPKGANPAQATPTESPKATKSSEKTSTDSQSDNPQSKVSPANTPRPSEATRIGGSPDMDDTSTAELTVRGGSRRTPSRICRAISTPSAAMTNITFYANGLPTAPSPIPKHMTRIAYDETDPSLDQPGSGSTPNSSPNRQALVDLPPDTAKKSAGQSKKSKEKSSDKSEAPTALSTNQKAGDENHPQQIQEADQSVSSRPKRRKRARQK